MVMRFNAPPGQRDKDGRRNDHDHPSETEKRVFYMLSFRFLRRVAHGDLLVYLANFLAIFPLGLILAT